MFEGQVAYYLNRYLGRYLNGLETESLKISVWKGDVQLKNLTLKPEALQDLNLPITVKAGLLGSLSLKVHQTLVGCDVILTCLHVWCWQPVQPDEHFPRKNNLLKQVNLGSCKGSKNPVQHSTHHLHLCCDGAQVPWARLGREPVVVEFDRLYILVGPRADEDQSSTQVCGACMACTPCFSARRTVCAEARPALSGSPVYVCGGSLGDANCDAVGASVSAQPHTVHHPTPRGRDIIHMLSGSKRTQRMHARAHKRTCAQIH